MSTRLNATKVLLAGACALTLAGGTVGAAAALSTDLTVRNTLELDTVDIRIQQQSSNLPLLISDGSYPHSAIISNLGADCYVRVRVVANAADLQATLTSMDGLDERDWVRAGDLLYYRHVLPENASVQFTQQVANPWSDRELDSKQLALTITAEAVQARNFTPDFSSADPWGGTAIEECVNSRKGVAQEQGSSGSETDARGEGLATSEQNGKGEAKGDAATAADPDASTRAEDAAQGPDLTETVLIKPLQGASATKGEGGTR